MEVTADDVLGFIDDAEPVINTGPGYVTNGSGRLEGSIAVTDRRVLFVSHENGSERVIEIASEAICSVDSRLQTRFTQAGLLFRALLGLGVLLAALSALGVIAYVSTPLEFSMALLAVTGALGAGYAYRFGVDVESTVLDETADLVRDRAPRKGSLTRYDWFEPSGDGDVVVTLATVASLALVSLVLFTSRPLLAPLVLVLLGSVVLIDQASKRKLSLDERNESQRHERAVTLDLASGRRVHIHVDSTRRIDRELGVLLHERERERMESAPVRQRHVLG